jgi:HK97 family phage prohead protease
MPVNTSPPPPPEFERRFVHVNELQVERRAGADGPPTIRGYAAVFNARSEDLGGWVETIAPGAFAEAIRTSDTRALWNHNPDYVLGRSKSRTLKLTEDVRGLHVECTPPDTQWARDLTTSIERGDVDQMSFGFRIAKGGALWTNEGDKFLRTITRVAVLYDVSPVTFPAYPDTEVAVRSLAEFRAADGGEDGAAAERGAIAHAERTRRLQLAEAEC